MAGLSDNLLYNGVIELQLNPIINDINNTMLLSQEVCQKARLSRDARFDGRFFTAVKTTGIYCRSICPATPPKEANVDYYPSAHLAAQAGFRPCLRCRPDSAPQSGAWLGNQALLNRAIKLINGGALENQSLAEFAEYLGISDRYLRQLFVKHVGVAPKAYALYQQCLMAKQLLHQTRLPINQIAHACGFNSVRRFNDGFIKAMQLTPSQIRKSGGVGSDELLLKLSYRPPYDWQRMHDFLQARLIHGLETIDTKSYGRSFELNGCAGSFIATHQPEQHAFAARLHCEDLRQLRPILNNIRRVLDLDTDTSLIEAHLAEQLPAAFQLKSGLRIPGIWSVFEAGIRAILGQQVSVQAARNLVTQLVVNLGRSSTEDQQYFPTPKAVAQSELAFIKMPGARKNSLRALAQHFLDSDDATDPDTWLAIKGIGPWTVNYAKMRGLSDPDIFLAGDLGVDKALKTINNKNINPELMSPWRSYLTFQLWNQLPKKNTMTTAKHKIFIDHLSSDIGLIEITATETGITSVYFVDQAQTPVTPNEHTDQCKLQLGEYLNNKRQNFDLSFDQHGTEFQCQVWQALLTIPFGQVVSYSDIAHRIKNPKAVRAVGAANGKNPISIIVPCHRVIGTNGTLTGYAGGLARKQWLLQHESDGIFQNLK